MFASLPCKLALAWPGGRLGAKAADVSLTLHDTPLLLGLMRGQIGQLADAYVRGRMDIEGSLADVMKVAAHLVGDPVKRGEQGLWPARMRHWRSRWRHHQMRDARSVQSHYDLSDEFFALWLDPRRVYSCAYFRDPGMSLAEAQEAKLDHICRKLQLAPGQRFLDVGAGWGGLLLWAAEHYGVQATGITLSQNQHRYVTQLIEERGLGGRVEMRLLDYRQLPESQTFDRIASVGMFEHVGRGHLRSYFARLCSHLRPGGLVLNHGITAGGLRNESLGAGIGDYIEQHIFPGGELVHVAQVAQHLAEGGLELLDAENLRPHYARTLWAWSDGLERQLEAARGLTDEAKVRAYRLYLAGSAMSFEQGWLSLYQLLAARPNGVADGVADGVAADAATTADLVTADGLRGAQSDYRFNRAHMYAQTEPENYGPR
ncbi:SAM-dependent methyltransferase [Roseateles oligotrophus]|uniref:Cyclopropane-fatty-acyl-phospholipid synthase family protein n=1 Tax=Roseateles oligotrophus TaxID=1769250 RepID=A0ABT2YN72_9BURK|nr:cyclopropane-fatty-acyl-phospholipid synthase family protein [Roseateles oligotrophus]MCV2371335.1 cyclopropane-fatty-acyl-phospholipid synthase family protein [Roseateles oligotrophus]